MRFDQPRYFRQSMSWLHTWSGLLLGWLLFAVFVTGTLSFFREEITLWMQPELHQARSGDEMLSHAERVLRQQAPRASQWFISLPDARSPVLELRWPAGTNRTRGSAAAGNETASPHPAAARQQSETSSPAPAARASHHRTEMKRLMLDPASGEILQPRQTAGGNFLYRFHFELYGIDRIWGRWIVGIATMFMLIAIISGVIVHRQIFKDFFTFRPGKGKRSWLDAHNLTSVLSLPFHFVITFSGLLLLSMTLLPSAIEGAYGDDYRAFSSELRGRSMQSPSPASGRPAELASLAAMLTAAQRHWREPAGTITVNHPGHSNATVEIRQAVGHRLGDRGVSDRIVFDGVSGEVLEYPPPPAPSAIVASWNVMGALHLGRFASPLPRWLLFIAGIGGSLMIATGMVMWTASRLKDRQKLGYTPLGHRLVEILNVAGIAGLLIAISAHFWANRLLPANLENRNHWEIRVFFLIWLATLAHAALRPHKRAWTEQLAAAGILTALLPVANGIGGAHLGVSVMAGQWQVAAFDLTALIIGLLLVFAAHKVWRHAPAARALRPRASRKAAPPPTDDGGFDPALLVPAESKEAS